MNTIQIKSGKEKQLVTHHPWVFSGAIESQEGTKPGVCKVLKSDGSFLAWGWWDEKSHIPVHLLSWNETDQIDDNWWKHTVAASVLRRRSFFDSDGSTTAFRIIFSEADMLPGIVADVYGTTIRIVISARVGWDQKDKVVETLDKMLHPHLMVITTDHNFLSIEGLKDTTSYYSNGQYFTPESRLEAISFKEDGLVYETIPGGGQKSDFYCDQRDNRKKIEKYCKGKNVLDGFSYTGGFTLHALRAEAQSVYSLDSSEPALHGLLRNIHLNEDKGTLPEGSRQRCTTKCCNVFEEMRNITKDQFDVMVLDPPKLAKTKGQAEKAARAYKDLNRLAMEKIRDNGIIATFSCSSAIDAAMLRTILAWASIDARCEVQVLEILSAGSDHPVRLSFPESEYLCGYILRVLKH
jgi:23S rRNA (cytosine1962-C5)-methyltransferase